MQLDSLSWFPGHMTKTRRMITAELGNVDAVCEILDARIPMSSRNPDVDELTAGKPRLIVLNRVDQADPEMTKKWAAYFRSLGCAVIETDAKQGGGVKQFSSAVRTLLHDKIASYEAKGQIGRVLRVMVLGIPNVGKSTFINKVSGRKSAKAEDRPGVTRTKQWVPVDKTLELLDTPGILWPKFEDQTVTSFLIRKFLYKLHFKRSFTKLIRMFQPIRNLSHFIFIVCHKYSPYLTFPFYST